MYRLGYCIFMMLFGLIVGPQLASNQLETVASLIISQIWLAAGIIILGEKK